MSRIPVVPVKKVTVVTLTDYEDELIRELGRLGVVDLRQLSEEEFVGLERAKPAEVRKYRELLSRVEALCSKLSIGEVPGVSERLLPLEEIEKTVSECERKLGEIESEAEKLRSQLSELEEVKRGLELLAKMGVEPGVLGEFQYSFAIAGLVPVERIPWLESLLKRVPGCEYEVAPVSDEESLVVVKALLEIKDSLMRILKLAEFREIKLPPDIPGKQEEARAWLEERIGELKRKLEAVESERERLKSRLAEELASLRKTLRVLAAVAEAKAKTLRSRLMTVLQGWVPTDKTEVLDRFFEEFRQRTSGRLLVFYEDPMPGEKPPTVLRNPRLFKAYESLVRQYGVPEATEADPTLITGILWTIMFGFMFPDLGQGLVILALGILFSKVLKRSEILGLPIRGLGRLMIGAGISAAVFGALTGDFFLTEHVIHPLWPGLTPGWVEKPYFIIWLLKVAVYFGIAQIVLGLLISVYNNVRRGHLLEAILGERGLAGLMIFLSMVFIAFEFIGLNVIPGVLEFPQLGLDMFYTWPYCIPVITLVAGILMLLAKSVIEKEDPGLTFGMIFEVLISSMTNMLSFARLAGFNLAHVALALVIAKLMEANPVLGIGMGLIFMNVFALTLELVIVMIQALRLVYYEFMSKFYSGTGIAFRPFKI